MQELIANAARYGDNIAIVDHSEHSYASLLQKSANISGFLLGSQNNDLNEEVVAFAAPAGADYVACLWGIWRAGGIAMPLNVHSKLPEVEHCVATGGVQRLLTTDDYFEQLAPLSKSHGVEQIRLQQLTALQPTALPEISPDRRAMMIFTSGTTSKPKGVVTTHKNIRAQVQTLLQAWEWQAEDSIPLFLPLHHVHGIINVLTCALWAGARVDAYAGGFDVQKVLQAVANGKYSVFMAVPTIYVKLIEAIEHSDDAFRRTVCDGFQSMRLMISGSAALPVPVHEKWQALTGQVLLERYGMTEIGMALSNPMHGERRPGSVGVPLPGVSIRLVGEDGQVVPAGEEDSPGEIQVRSDTVFLEYWNNPQATADSFEGDWFRTGDMAVLENAYYRIMGRLSVDIIKSGAYKLSALEIENVLLGHAAIAECAVLGLPDDTWGEIVAAAVVLAPGAQLSLEELQTWAANDLSNYKLPRVLKILDALPRNAMGKITKPALLNSLQSTSG